MYIWGWAGQGAVLLGGGAGLWSGPSPALRVVNVFRVGGREMEPPVCWGERVGGASHLALGFSGILYLPSVQGWEGREGGHAVDMACPLLALEEGS